jgi:signal transduction histidine kinase
METLSRDTNHADLRVTFEAQGAVRRLGSETELALYRIVQEAINNAVRHAHASSLQVTVEFAPDNVTFCVQDDGAGFTVPQRVGDLVSAGHYGLMGMQERAQLIGAKLSIRSKLGEGTSITAQL